MKLTILTGNIGTGKSLIASKLAKRDNAVVVNMDNIQQIISGGNYGMYDHDKIFIYHEIENNAIIKALELGFDVVIDRTCINKRQREAFIKIGKEYNAEIISINFGNDSKQYGLERRLKHSRGTSNATWEAVHKHMLNSYEKPSLDEGFIGLIQAPTKYTFHAFDFDGIIVTNEFPNIGEPANKVTSAINDLFTDFSNIVIIWSCRSGDYESQMRQFLIKNKICFDFINENPIFDTKSNKIFAHYYYDDRNIVID